MKKLCPNLAREDGLQTVLEVPIPEEIFTIKSGTSRAWHNMKSWMKPNVESSTSSSLYGDQNTDMQLLLGVVGAPLIPLPITSHNQPITIKSHNIVSTLVTNTTFSLFSTQFLYVFNTVFQFGVSLQ